MSVSWTNEQLDAINAQGRAIIVSAAAGSGKTAVLVEKLLRLLSDREKNISADRIVVVTFTNDAAAQMKQRLSAAMTAALEEEPENEWLIRQQSLIPSAKISTIHSFCFDLIRENAGLAGVDHTFRIADETEDAVISAQAAEKVFDRWFAEKADDMMTLTDFFSAGAANSGKLMNLIPFLSKNILALPFPFIYMDRITKRYSEPPSPENDSFIKIFGDYALRRIRLALMYADEAIELAEEAYGDDIKTVEKLGKTMTLLREERDMAARLCDRISADPMVLFDGSLNPTFERITFHKDNKRGDKKYDGPAAEAAKNKRGKCKELILECTDLFTVDEIRSDYQHHARICAVLFELLKEIFTEQEIIKKEKNILGFSDAEQFACRLLCDVNEDGTLCKSKLAEELSKSFDIVMIDEFQDSTAVQELIFRMISKNGTADVPGTDFFAVGDVKQSIYRFRCADPTIFIKNTENSVPYDDNGDTSPAKILLNKNFRSSHHVVEFVNAVFTSIMSAENGGIDYGTDDSLIEGAGIEDDFGPTEIILIPKTEEATSESPASEEDDETDENAASAISPVDIMEAKCVAVKIRKMLDSCSIHDKGIERRVVPSDFCILMRSKDKSAVFIKCLEELGIPASGEAKESYLEAEEVSVLINLLRTIDNPTRDIPLASVLMSPMFMFSAEDLARLRIRRGPSLYSDVIASASGEKFFEKETKLRIKCSEFMDDLGELREYASSHNIRELIDYIYDKTDFLSVVSVYKNSSRKKANLRLLPIYAAQYDKNGTGCLSGFLRQIDKMTDNSKDFQAASASAGTENAVQIKTIHKSKGLEFPFVFLCDTWGRFNLKDANKSCVFVSDHGPAFRISNREMLNTYETFPRYVLSLLKKRSMRDEEMMLLYVALTRAKHKLFITRRTDEKSYKRREAIGALTDITSIKQNDAVDMGLSMADWLDAALELFQKKDDVYVKGSCSVILTEGEHTYVTDTNETEETASQNRNNDETAEKLREILSRKYDMTLSGTAAKLTVSEIISKDVKIYKKNALRRKANNLPQGISAAEAGTAVHEFMQYADIKKLYEARNDIGNTIKSETDRLLKKGYLTKRQTECVDSDMIKTFAQSGLCEMMANADVFLREKKFLVKISDLNLDDKELMVYNGTEGMLQGVADCVFRVNGEYILMDYKTNRNVTEDDLRDSYEKQLMLYARALSLIFGQKISKAYIYSFSLGKAIGLNLN